MCVKKEVLIRVSRFSIDLNNEAYVNLNCTVQEGQTVFFYVFSGESSVLLRCIENAFSSLVFIDPVMVWLAPPPGGSWRTPPFLGSTRSPAAYDDN